MVKAKIVIICAAAALLCSCSHSYKWQKFSIDGHRTGVTVPSAGNVPEALGTVENGIYTSPNGEVFKDGATPVVAELLIYSIAAIILAPLGEKVLSANQIVFNFISLVFMIPLGLAKALTVMVSFAIGERNLPEARRCTTSAQLLSFVLSAAVSAIIFAAPEAIAAIYTDDEAVIALLMPALLVAAVQPFPDFQQITAQGALRGYRETKSIFFVTLISYWIVGLPLGYALSMTDLIVPKMGMIGFWIGFLAGIFTASALYFLTLFLRVFRMKSVKI